MRVSVSHPWWFPALAAALLAGCIDLGADAMSVPEQHLPRCAGDADCDAASRCDPNAALCVKRGSSQAEVSLRLVPATVGAEATEEQYETVQLNSAKLANFQMHRPLRVVGRVFQQDNPLAAVSDVEVAVSGASEIPGLQAQAQAVGGLPFLPGDDTQGKPSAEGSFEFYVLKNRPYDVYVHLPELTAQDLPPYHVRRSFSAPPNAADPYTVTLDLQVPSLDAYLTLSGTVAWREAPGSEPHALVGAKVVGFSKESGHVTSTGVTDADGAFTLRVQPPDGVFSDTYVLQLRPSSANEMVPDLELGTWTTSAVGQLEPMYVEGALTPNDVVVSLSGVSEADAATLMGTLIRAESRWGDNGTLLVERTLQGTTWTSLKLPAGLYTFSLIPPTESRWSSAWQTVTVQAVALDKSVEPQQVEFALQPRLTLEGKVIGPAGHGVAQCTVRAVRYATPFGAAIPRKDASLSVYSTYAEDDGSFRMQVDSGTYLLVADPGLPTGLPRTFLWDVVVVEPSKVDIPVSAPHAFTGDIQAPRSDLAVEGIDGKEYPLGPARGVRVEVYDPAWPENLSPIPLGDSLTDESGRFVLLLPAPSQD